MVCLDANAFSLSLSGRRDRSFYTYRQLCQFLYKLARRCSTPQDLPPEEIWPEILNLDLSTTTALSVTNFLSRAKFGSKLDAACKIKAGRDRLDNSNAELSVDTLSSRNKEEFGRAARSYVTFLFNSFQELKGLTNDLVKGLGCFDLEILLLGPIAYATYCHAQLFTSFRLRGYFTTDQETASGEEYLSFLDDLRRSYSDVAQPTLLIPDTVKFLVELPSLHSRPLLYKLFRLACLCLDEPFPVLPSVKFGSVSSDDPTSSLFDVILPVQSYFANVPHSIDAVTTDQSVADFLGLEPDFVDGVLSDNYCPWDSVDFFGRSKILEQLTSDRSRPQASVSFAVPKVAESSKSHGTSKSSPKKSSKRASQQSPDKEVAPSVKALLTPSSSKV